MNGVLGIDPAAHTGFAHSDGFRGVWPLVSSVDRFHGQKLVRLRDHLHTTLQSHPTTLICGEDASFGSRNRQIQALHNELRGIIYMVAADWGLEVKLFQPTTIKSFAAGNGHATKLEMILAVKRHWGIDVLSDDEADAICIMKLGCTPSEWPVSAKKAGRFKRKGTSKGGQRKLF